MWTLSPLDAVVEATMESTEEGETAPVMGFRPRLDISLQVPRQLLTIVGNRSMPGMNRRVRMVSLLHKNVLELFPNATLQGME
jgi:hypothetical protein